jgi:hypothetical protein
MRIGIRFPVRINAAKAPDFTAPGFPKTLPDGTVMTDPTHCIMTSKTHLNWLGDVLDFHDSIESVGDELIELGTWLNTFCLYVWLAIIIDRRCRS